MKLLPVRKVLEAISKLAPELSVQFNSQAKELNAPEDKNEMLPGIVLRRL